MAASPTAAKSKIEIDEQALPRNAGERDRWHSPLTSEKPRFKA